MGKYVAQHSVDTPAFMTDPIPHAELLPAPLAEITRATTANAGCWVDGHWGWKGIGRVIEIAVERGWPITREDADDLAVYMFGNYATDDDEGRCDRVAEAADDAERWLTDNVAPPEHSFGWHDGEFYLWSDARWCANGDDRCDCVTPHDDEGEPLQPATSKIIGQ